MGEFRIGRRHASHSYPDTGSKASPPIPPARNFAFGPGTDTGILTTPGTDVPWSNLESGAAGVNVPITPRVTGRLSIRAMLMLKSTVASSVTINVRVDGITTIAIPFSVPATPAANLNTPVPLLVETTVTLAPHTIQIRCVASGDDGNMLVANQCSVEVQELVGAAG